MGAIVSKIFHHWRRRQNKKSYARLAQLDPSKPQIRLLELKRRDASSPLEGELVIADLDHQCPRFLALSYVWGDSPLAHRILLQNGNKLWLNDKLFQALHDIRLPQETLIVWADAICINQEDHDEKASQIKLMQRIYRDACEVKAWLDLPFNVNAEVFQELEKRPVEIESLGQLADRNEAFWDPFAAILRDRYFQRIWIHAEVILATSRLRIQLREGLVSINITLWILHFTGLLFDLRFTSPRSLYKHYWTILRDVKMGPRFGLLLAMATARERPSFDLTNLDMAFVRGSLLACFTDLHILQSTKPHDHVYGLLSLANDYTSGEITVDYKRSEIAVYSQVADFYIRKHKSLVFLCYRTNSETASMHIPTWLPAPKKQTHMMWGTVRRSGEYTAASYAQASISRDGRKLFATGVCVDEVIHVGRFLELNDLPIARWSQTLAEYFGQENEGIDPDDFRLFYPWEPSKKFGNTQLLDPAVTDHVTKLFQKLLALPRLLRKPKLTLNAIAAMGNEDSSSVPQEEMDHFRYLADSPRGGQVFKTQEGRLGLYQCTIPVKKGDHIWALYGCPAPLILRPSSSKGEEFTWIGCPDNIPGLMQGEAFVGSMPGAPIELV